jgi:hypothetical protein
MMVDMPTWISDLERIAPAVLIPAGALIAVTVLVLIGRALRKQQPDKLAVKVAVALASAFSAQGMYEVATTRLHLPWYLAAGLFAVAEAAMLASAVRAHRHYEATATAAEPGSLGPHARFVWLIAFAAGGIVSLNAHSPSEYFLRLLMPLLVAGLWRMGYVAPDVRAKAADAITLRWTPRRLGVLLGIIEPGERDLATVNAERQRRQMIAHAHAYHRGSLLLGWWHAARLRKLALLAGDDQIADVQRSVDRVHRVEASTAPKDTGGALTARWWLHPWTSARRTAIAVAELTAVIDLNRTEVAAESVRVAERISELNRDLNSALERAEAGELTERNLRAQFVLDLSAYELAARTEAERRAELTIGALRSEISELTARLASRPEQRRAEPTASRAKSQTTTALISDANIAGRLFAWFCEQTELTGKPPTRYRVELAAPCHSRQADRVRELMLARWAELKGAPNGTGPATGREPNRTGEPSDVDLEHELAAELNRVAV